MASTPETLRAVWLGRMGFADALERQLAAREEVVAGAPGLLLLVEHPPVLTLGRRARREDILWSEAERAAARCTAWILPLAALFDLGENLLQLHLLGGPFGGANPAVPLSACCSAVKWGLVVAFALIVAWRVLRKSARIGLLSQ